jgi:uncharacterized protein YjgD (DUF1641 family)
MTNEELILQRLDAIESQLSPLIKTANEMMELKNDLIPLGNTAVQVMIEELQEVEAAFKLEDVFYLLKQTMRNISNFTFMLKQMENIIEFVNDLEPLMKSAVPNVISHLDELERKGVFRIIKATMDVRAKIASAYTPEDVEQIGDGAVAMLGLAKKMSDPKVIDFLERAVGMLSDVDLEASKKVGPFGLMAAGFNSEIKDGLGVMMELTKAMGKLKKSKDTSALAEAVNE